MNYYGINTTLIIVKQAINKNLASLNELILKLSSKLKLILYFCSVFRLCLIKKTYLQSIQKNTQI